MSDDPVEALFERAAHNGVTMAAICKLAGVAASTPSRWRSNPNAWNNGTLRKLNDALDSILSERSSSEAAAAA